MFRSKVIPIEKIGELIADNAVVTVSSSSGLGCPDASLRSIGKHFLEQGKPRGITSLHPIAAVPPRRTRLRRQQDLFLELARNCDVLIPSLAEAEIMTGLDNEGEPMLDALLSLGPPQVILKAGDKGAWYADGTEHGF